MEIKEKILTEENEVKPNRYAANVLIFMLLIIMVAVGLNEYGIFHVNVTRMRECGVLAIIFTIVGSLIGYIRPIARSRKTKYIMLTMIGLETMAACTLLSQWTELLLAIPIVLAMQYHNRTVTLYSIAAAFSIAFVTAPLAVYLGLQQANFYQFLLETTGYKILAIAPDPNFDMVSAIERTVLFVSVPRCFEVAILSFVAFFTTKHTYKNIRNRAEVTYLSSTDVLTGLMNRMSYEAKVQEYSIKKPSQLICVYADADGLHELNNQFGHEAGDEMLCYCAELLRKQFGDDTYRIGGDEFVAFTESGNAEEVERKVEDIRLGMAERGYHASLGISVLKKGETVDELVKNAEHEMYEAKRRYYSEAGRDRRRRRD